MKPLARKLTIAVAGVSLIALLASPLMAGGTHSAEGADPVQLAHMNQGSGSGWGSRMGMMGGGMMGGGMMGIAAVGDGHCTSTAGVAVDQDLSINDVREHLKQSLKHHGNTRLKVGDITETDHNTIIADIVTVDDSLVRRMEVDRLTGSIRSIQ